MISKSLPFPAVGITFLYQGAFDIGFFVTASSQSTSPFFSGAWFESLKFAAAPVVKTLLEAGVDLHAQPAYDEFEKRLLVATWQMRCCPAQPPTQAHIDTILAPLYEVGETHKPAACVAQATETPAESEFTLLFCDTLGFPIFKVGQAVFKADEAARSSDKEMPEVAAIKVKLAEDIRTLDAKATAAVTATLDESDKEIAAAHEYAVVESARLIAMTSSLTAGLRRQADNAEQTSLKRAEAVIDAIRNKAEHDTKTLESRAETAIEILERRFWLLAQGMHY